MAKGFTAYAALGAKINGVVKQYQVETGKTIIAGEFVDIVNGKVTNAVSTVLGGGNINATSNFGGSNWTGFTFRSAVLLDDNRALLFIDVTPCGATGCWACVITFNSDGCIDFGRMWAIDTNYRCDRVHGVVLENGTVVVTYAQIVVASTCYVRLIALNVNEDAISVGYANTLSSPNASVLGLPSVCKVGTNKVLVSYCDSNGLVLVSAVSSGLASLTLGTSIVAEAGVYYFNTTVVSAGVADKAVVLYQGPASTYYGKAVVCTVSGNTPAKGAAVVIRASSVSYLDGVNCGVDKVLVNLGGNNGMFLNISGTTITAGAVIPMTTAPWYLYNGRLYVFYTTASVNYCSVYTFTGDTLNLVKTFIVPRGKNLNTAQAAFKSAGDIITFCGLNPRICSELTTSKGVAKTGGTGGQTIDVYVKQ